MLLPVADSGDHIHWTRRWLATGESAVNTTRALCQRVSRWEHVLFGGEFAWMSSLTKLIREIQALVQSGSAVSM